MSNIYNIGDEVYIQVSTDDYEWINALKIPDIRDGTLGVVCAIDDDLFYQGRTRVIDIKPGVYHKKGAVSVWLEDGRIINNVTYRIILRDRDEFHQRIEHYRSSGANLNLKRLGDLPPTDFWEEDEVIVHHEGYDEKLIVHSINYHSLHSHKENGSPCNIYNLRHSLYQSSRSSYPAASLELVNRGNVWKHYHKTPLSFKDIEEEVTFYKSIGYDIDSGDKLIL